MSKLSVLIIFSLLLSSCKKDKSGDNGSEALDLQKITLTTNEAVLRSDESIRTGGKASIDLSKYSNLEYGVSFGEDENPTIEDNISISTTSSGGDFDNVIGADKFNAEKPLFIRAYVKNKSSNSIKYGNQIRHSNSKPLTIIAVKNISAAEFTVDFKIEKEFKDYEIGFCFNESPNPTIDDSPKRRNPTKGEGTYSLTFKNTTTYKPFEPGISYYLRVYASDGFGKHAYSEPVTFRAAGFRNERGGLVFFDKGAESEGWRYLEAATEPLKTTTTYFRWGCNESAGENIYTSTEVGSGMSNTMMIKDKCKGIVNNAAAMTLSWVHNSKNDWFIPSYSEYLLLLDAYFQGLLYGFAHERRWTSSQFNTHSAYSFYTYDNSDYITVAAESKDSKDRALGVWPIRKY